MILTGSILVQNLYLEMIFISNYLIQHVHEGNLLSYRLINFAMFTIQFKNYS